MNIFDFLKIKKNNDNSIVYGFASKEAEAGKGLSEEQLQAMRQHLSNFLQVTNQQDKAINIATQLMAEGAYEASIEAYQKILQKYAEVQDVCYSQIGVAYFFLDDYEQAITYYLKARSIGADVDMMDDNIWEACEILYQETDNKIHLEQYIEWCPNGKYSKKANRLLGKA